MKKFVVDWFVLAPLYLTVFGGAIVVMVVQDELYRRKQRTAV